MRRATDKELEEFFAETTFEGIFSYEIKSKNLDFYKGCITNIKLEGRTSNLTPLFLNVPKSSKSIPEGPCSFKCRMNIDAFRSEPSKYILNLVGKTLKSISTISAPSIAVNSKETNAKELFDMWGVDNCQCIGYYHYDEDNDIYLVDDLRKPNFDHIPYYPGDKDKKAISISYPNKILGIKLNDYYLFTWKLSHRNAYNPYEIVLDFETQQPQRIDPKWFIDTLFDDRHNDKSKNFGSAANFLDTLSKQLSAKESTFIYELLQNANDYPVEGHMVDVEFHITDNYLLFMHSGEKFNVRNISGICGINEKEKTANKKTIGYKGIGFKTVFLNNHYVYLKTGNYSFRFDEGEMPEKKMGGKIRRLGAPFQILPIWTSHEEVSQEVNNIFDNAARKFRVKIALRPEDKALLHVGRSSYETLFREVFSDSNIILFIPNINSVRVFINGNVERTCYRKNEEWIVGDYENEIDFGLQEIINKTIEKGNSRIPEKYKDFEYTKVSFACKHQGTKILPVEDATLYCYLPTRASWGFPFLMNTDMIPKGDRSDIETEVKLLDGEETSFNEELASIAGNKLFWWARDLLTSRKYDLGSVFLLVPDFKKCKKEHSEYERFIDCFEASFNNCVENETIVPVQQGISKVSHVILDTTGLSSSGIMTDDEFRNFSGMEDYYLPLQMLRNDKHFVSFFKRYAEKDQKFELDNLRDMIANEDFQEWLKVQENNNKFLKFLLENDYLQNLLEEEIFLEDEGSLFAAAELYYDVDEYLVDLQAFTDNIYFLSPKTRQFFKNNDEWNSVVDGAFAQFDCDEFVDSVLLSSQNKTKTIEHLKDKNTSIHFFKFLSEHVGFSDNYLGLPFFNDSDEVVDDFNDKFIFVSSKHGHDICDKDWMTGIVIEFISSDYDNKTKEYFKGNFGVNDFTDNYLVENVILNDNYKDDISEAINDNFEISKDFLLYCYSQKKQFNIKSLCDISLKVFDGDGEEQWYIADGDVFFPSSTVDYYSKRNWVDASWMVVLDEAYFDGVYNTDDLKKFIADSFGVEELVEKNFYENIVKQHLNDIYNNISGQNDADGTKNIDFVRYLDDSFKLIFEQKKDYDKFDELILVTSEINDVGKTEDNLYLFDSELNDIINCKWFPDDLVKLCHPDYGQSNALKKIGVKSYLFKEFYDDVIVEQLDSINKHINSKEDSIAFHSFVIGHLSELTDDQKEKMQGAIVYLYGQDKPVDISSGHNILSASAKELLNLGLVEFSDLDILDPDYEPEKNSEYWGTRLGNTKFTITHFMNWLKDNFDAFANTLKNKELNISFWRWLKENVSEKLIDEAASLPVLLKDDTIDAEGPIYFSDEYMEGAGIEHSVKIFDEDAKFLSPDYINDGDDKEQWRTLFTNAGIKHEILDILVETVIPQLSEIDDEGLPKLIADNREKLEKHFEDGLIPHITDLRVKAQDGNFYSINETIYIDCEKGEPFPYIELPNQIAFGSAEERRLIKDIIDNIGGDCVVTLSDWQQRKLDCYLDMQDEDSDSVRGFHFKFINDLSIIRNNNRDTLKEIEHIKDIQLLNKDNEFCNASTLTMGTVYNPFFDFEACGIESLDYVSDKYSQECKEYVGKFFRNLDIHCDFQEEDVELLEIRKCAIYFWGTYLLKKDASISRVKQLMSDKLFDEIACIPTTNYMKCASELYYGNEVNIFINNIEDGENKVPLKELPDVKLSDDTTLFSNLPFKNSLDFLDALYALINVNGQDKRIQLLRWMIDSYDEEYDDVIRRYRDDEHALWYNTRNENIQIKELYALDYWNKSLEQYFGSNNPRIINKHYFPAGDAFKDACDILGIKTICAEDLVMVPDNDNVFSKRNLDLRLFALVIAGKIDVNGWQERYNEYCDKLENMTLHRCSSIKISYKDDETINQSLKKFYHEKGSDDFYFVKSLDDKRVFQYFVKEYIDYIGVDEEDIAQELVEDIMDSFENALAIVKEDNTLMIDDDFKNALEKLIPNIKRELYGNEAAEDDEVSTIYRPTFSTKNNQEDETNVEFNIGGGHFGNTSEVFGETESSSDEFLEERFDNVENGETHNETNDYLKDSSDDSRHDRNNQTTGGRSYGGYSSERTSSSKIGEERKKNPDVSDVFSYIPDPDQGDLIGSVDNNKDFEPVGAKPHKPIKRKHPKQFTKEELERLRSNGSPLELESLPPTEEEINILEQCGISPEQIADTNYLAQLRLYHNLKEEHGEEPEESLEDFIKNSEDVSTHKMRSGKYIHSCSAARGVMYISPTVWNKMLDEQWAICVYLDGKGKNFHYINSPEDFLQLVEKDDVVIKITGKEKVDVVRALYTGLLEGVKGTAYTLVRVAARTNMDAVFAHYVGAMAEPDDGNEDTNEY